MPPQLLGILWQSRWSPVGPLMTNGFVSWNMFFVDLPEIHQAATGGRSLGGHTVDPASALTLNSILSERGRGEEKLAGPKCDVHHISEF